MHGDIHDKMKFTIKEFEAVIEKPEFALPGLIIPDYQISNPMLAFDQPRANNGKQQETKVESFRRTERCGKESNK